MNSNLLEISIKGSTQAVNQDFVMHVFSSNRAFVIVADGASNSFNGGEYMATFCKELAREWELNNSPIDRVIIISLIKKVHKSLIRDFICAKGSFILLVFDLESDVGHCFYLGDCRLGILSNSQVEWLNQPHSLAIAQGIKDEKALCDSPSRHSLYRLLSAKRFEEPEYFTLNGLSQVIILATDGFWSIFPCTLPSATCLTSIKQFITKMTPSDDASLLIGIPTTIKDG